MESRGLSSASLVLGQGETGASLEAPAEPKLWKIAIAFSIYGTLNLFLNFFNKWAMAPSGAGFGLPVFYSTWHMLMSIIGSLVLMLIKKPESGMVSFAQLKMYKWETLTLAVCTTVNISCNNASLMLLGLFVNQVIKALSPMIVMGMSYFVLKRRYGPMIIVSVIFIAIGAMLAGVFGLFALVDGAATYGASRDWDWFEPRICRAFYLAISAAALAGWVYVALRLASG